MWSIMSISLKIIVIVISGICDAWSLKTYKIISPCKLDKLYEASQISYIGKYNYS